MKESISFLDGEREKKGEMTSWTRHQHTHTSLKRKDIMTSDLKDLKDNGPGTYFVGRLRSEQFAAGFVSTSISVLMMLPAGSRSGQFL